MAPIACACVSGLVPRPRAQPYRTAPAPERGRVEGSTPSCGLASGPSRPWRSYERPPRERRARCLCSSVRLIRAGSCESAWVTLTPASGRKRPAGLHTAACRSVGACDPALWKTLFGNMLLSGGTGSCAGLRLRLQKEMTALVSPPLSVKVLSCPYSICSAWVGGSILCSLSTFTDMWVTSGEYKDIGSSVVSRRSF
ncbi:actin, alpha skeletal muscle-like [Dasypus novemcinctus]|uniref:actin, alpha skeletal muscle-like n=1 Tax=Dasypus novemcinctus TaxID=9361 RepID=UPI00265D841C|nr:actin, alpha skeletal muscle-like [Dasypus novemcinctus]